MYSLTCITLSTYIGIIYFWYEVFILFFYCTISYLSRWLHKFPLKVDPLSLIEHKFQLLNYRQKNKIIRIALS